LLDTCAALWYFLGSDNIPSSLKSLLRKPEHELFMSDVSLLEVVLKQSLGKLDLGSYSCDVLPLLATKHLVDPLPLTQTAILALQELPMLHRDPFDRLLVCQALENGMTLVTPDSLIQRYAVNTLWE